MIVKSLPNIDLKGPEDLLNFYKALGWNGNDQLNPKKILINKEEAKKLSEIFINNHNEGEKESATFFWLNYAPSTNDNVPKGKVHLLKNWIK